MNEEPQVEEKEEEEENIFLKPKKRTSRKVKNDEDTKEFEKITHDEENINSILGNDDDDIPLAVSEDIFNLIDSMYDEEEK